MEEQSVFKQIKAFLSDRFDLNADKADQAEVVENIRKGVEFRGTNLWILIFAIVIASVGLNINSTAVIIGAMLISPLMGPIMGVGLSLGINDFELLKKSVKNFAFAVLVSLLASTLYFMITPMSTAQSELLARTTPSTWDVLIATFGGLAGIVAASRKDRTSTVIPGVAIATALMPPMCTAGFGLATGQWDYFGGALYLFFINAVFIAFATFFIVRFMKYERKHLLDPKRAKRVRHYMVIILTATLVPSVIMAYGIVQRTNFETSAQRFADQYFSRGVTTIKFDRKNGNTIDISLVVPMSDDSITYAKAQLANYGLTGARLTIHQTRIDVERSSSTTLEHLLNASTDKLFEKDQLINELRNRLTYYTTDTLAEADITKELSALQQGIEDVALARTDMMTPQGEKIKRITLCVMTLKPEVDIDKQKQEIIRQWLVARTRSAEVLLVVDHVKTNQNIL